VQAFKLSGYCYRRNKIYSIAKNPILLDIYNRIYTSHNAFWTVLELFLCCFYYCRYVTIFYYLRGVFDKYLCPVTFLYVMLHKHTRVTSNSELLYFWRNKGDICNTSFLFVIKVSRCVFVCVYVCVYIYIYIYIYTHYSILINSDIFARVYLVIATIFSNLYMKCLVSFEGTRWNQNIDI